MNKKLFIIPGVFLSILLLVIVSFIVIASNQNATLAKQDAERNDLLNQSSVRSAEMKKEKAEIYEEATGLNMSRVAKDKKFIKEFTSTLSTWKSFDEYSSVRKKISKDYDIPMNSEFMTVFMPEVENDVFDGKNYNTIDMYGLNMTYTSNDTYVKSINGTKYNYFTIMTIISKYGGQTVEGKQVPVSEQKAKAVLEYTVDSKGVITNISASIAG